jgi:hypothetical protein
MGLVFEIYFLRQTFFTILLLFFLFQVYLEVIFQFEHTKGSDPCGHQSHFDTDVYRSSMNNFPLPFCTQESDAS